VRIIGGKWKRRRLESSFDLNKAPMIRPTTDRVKENIFNIIENLNTGNPLVGARVLDIFCGTGAMGLEALSRGADFCHFVDKSSAAKRISLLNISKLGAEKSSRFTMIDILDLSHNNDLASDLVFLDPPYEKNLGDRAISILLKYGWVKRHAIFVLEKEIKSELSCDLKLIDQRKYGKTEINILSAFDLKI